VDLQYLVQRTQSTSYITLSNTLNLPPEPHTQEIVASIRRTIEAPYAAAQSENAPENTLFLDPQGFKALIEARQYSKRRKGNRTPTVHNRPKSTMSVTERPKNAKKLPLAQVRRPPRRFQPI